MTLPEHILHQILQNTGDCRDLFSFSQTSRSNYNIFKKDAIHVLRMLLIKKNIEMDVGELYSDIKRCTLKSPPFAYLSGTGIYQREFDEMPDKQISSTTSVTWSQIRESLLYLSKCFQNNRIPKSKKYFPLQMALNLNLYKRNAIIPLDTMSLLIPSEKTKLIHNKESKFSRERLKYIGQRDENGNTCSPDDPVYLLLTSLNFDKYIDEIIKLNKHRWSKSHCREYLIYPLVIPRNANVQSILIKILCGVLKESPVKLYDVDNKFARFDRR